ncbi:Zinc metalloproteinase nas-14 [Orchesella cincta]|uniref:Metalloendopeptidase n=1 Tax=Orchesella cincta TaxID=48709 RepID=A0A1D2M395_ORCCI|nr:Zinc metalloproteinase nas-14 [Orchesella cincta]
MDTIIIILGATIGIASAVPLGMYKPLPPTPPLSDVSPFENVTAPTCTTMDNVMTIKNGMIAKHYRWKTFNVHPAKAYNQQELQSINDAMHTLSQVIPCVTFGIWPPDSNPTGDYVHIIKGTANGCNSFVGRLGGKQNMNLQSPGCMSKGTIMHEMIHALGFHHEHGRPNRDDHVTILLQNVTPGMEYAFNKLPADQVTAFGVPYNLHSIMHYDSHAFSKNGNPTMRAKNGNPIGSEGVLKESDKKKLKAMYEC